MKEQVSKLIQMGVIPCDSELSNEKFKEYDELLIFDETLSIDEAEAIVVLFSKDCDDLNWGLLHAVESAYSENEIEKYEYWDDMLVIWFKAKWIGEENDD